MSEQTRFALVWLAIGAAVAVFWVLFIWGAIAVTS